MNGHDECVRTLVEAGADRTIKANVSAFQVLGCHNIIYRHVLWLYRHVGDIGVYLASVDELEKEISQKIKKFQKNNITL